MWNKSRQCHPLTATATCGGYRYSCHSLRFSSLQKSPPEALRTAAHRSIHCLSNHTTDAPKNTHKLFGRTNGRVSYQFFSVRAGLAATKFLCSGPEMQHLGEMLFSICSQASLSFQRGDVQITNPFGFMFSLLPLCIQTPLFFILFYFFSSCEFCYKSPKPPHKWTSAQTSPPTPQIGTGAYFFLSNKPKLRSKLKSTCIHNTCHL